MIEARAAAAATTGAPGATAIPTSTPANQAGGISIDRLLSQTGTTTPLSTQQQQQQQQPTRQSAPQSSAQPLKAQWRAPAPPVRDHDDDDDPTDEFNIYF